MNKCQPKTFSMKMQQKNFAAANDLKINHFLDNSKIILTSLLEMLILSMDFATA